MSRSLRALLPLVASTALVALTGTAFAQGKPAADGPRFGLGRAASPQEIAGWDIDVRPDGHGVRKGKGTVAQGQDLYDAQCASCHGTFGESNRYMAIAGGVKPEDLKTGRASALQRAGRDAHRRHQAQLRDDAVGLHQPRDAVDQSAVADGRPGLRDHGLRAAPERDRSGGLRAERREPHEGADAQSQRHVHQPRHVCRSRASRT